MLMQSTAVNTVQAPVPSNPAPAAPVVEQSLLVKMPPTRREKPVPVYDMVKDKLLFMPKAWAKILYMRDRDKSEISGFGISAEKDPLRIIDFKLVAQVNMAMFTEFVDKGLADYVTDMCMAGIPPARSFRVWIHTHPNMGVSPSTHDVKTFARTTEQANWGVMCIVSDKDASARLVVNADGLSSEKQLPVVIAREGVFEGVTEADYQAWEDEYCACVHLSSVDATRGAGVVGAYSPDWQDELRWGQRSEVTPSEPTDLEDSLEAMLAEVDVNGEIVERIDVNPDGYVYVCTDNWWFQFNNAKEIICDVGETLVTLGDLSFMSPVGFGTCEWDGNVPTMHNLEDDLPPPENEQETYDTPCDGDVPAGDPDFGDTGS